MVCCFYFSLFLTLLVVGKTFGNSSNNTIIITNASPSSPVQINCSNIELSNVSWTYERPGSTVTEISTSFDLNITLSSNVGTYNCLFDEEIVKSVVAANLTTPVIPHVGRSITYIEGSEDESISCFSYSFPYPTFAWSLSRSDGSSISLPEQGNGFIITNNNQSSSITFTSVLESHRGEYICSAHNSAIPDPVAALVLLRVHQRLAPLWPFLAIVVEMIAIFIIMYFIRRHARAKEDRSLKQRLPPQVFSMAFQAWETLGAPFQESESSETSQDSQNLNVRYRNNVATLGQST